MLMTVAHRARLKPRSHSPVVRWIRNPLSSDSGVRIPLSALHLQRAMEIAVLRVFSSEGGLNGVFAPPFARASGIEGVRLLHQFRDVVLDHSGSTRFEQRLEVFVHAGHGAHAKGEGFVKHLGEALRRTWISTFSDRGGDRERP